MKIYFFFFFFLAELSWSDSLINSPRLLSVCVHTLISSPQVRKTARRTSIKARKEVIDSTWRAGRLSRNEMLERPLKLQVILREKCWEQQRCFLICSSGAMHTDQYADLSQTDCMMFCVAPSTITHKRSINHPALLLSPPRRRGTASFYSIFPQDFLFCHALFVWSLGFSSHW